MGLLKGHIHKQGDHSWRISVYLGKDESGKKLRHYETVQGTHDDAEARVVEILNEVNKKTFTPPTKMTVGEFMNRWLEDYVRVNRRPPTYDFYQGLLKTQILPTIGSVDLAALTPMMLQRLYAAKAGAARLDTHPGKLSASTVKHVHDTIRAALGQAVKWGLLSRNPALAVTPPRPQKLELAVWDADQCSRFLDTAHGDPYYGAFLLAIAGGLRRGEILGLRWQDVDLEARTVAVRQNAVMSHSQGLILQAPKTAGSQRVIAISEDTAAAIEARRAENTKAKEAYDDNFGPGSYTDMDLVFAGHNGKPLDVRSFTRRFERLMTKAGVPRIRFHDLRHTHSTLMLSAGTHVRVIAQRLGHASVRTTMITYAYVLPGLDRNVADQVDGLLKRRKR